VEKTGKVGALGASGCLTVQERLLRYLQSKRIHPALLFIGPEKELKYQVAKGMAKFLFCQAPSQRAFCGQCSNCKRIEKEIHPDVYFFKEDSEDTLKIETVREVIGQMRVSPIEGPYKICVIDEAHRMNSAAANAFLKTLEEPGEGRFFILTTTQSGSILPTVSSRCIEFVFRPENQGVFLTESEQTKYRDLLTQVAKTKDYGKASSSLEEKEEALKFLQFLQAEIYQSILAQETGTSPALFFTQFSSHQLTLTFDSVVTLEGQLRSNANYALMIESFLRKYFSGVSL
jgi:DNA polymerase III delta' subunit